MHGTYVPDSDSLTLTRVHALFIHIPLATITRDAYTYSA
uniref:Uncharacterized protein n=1 Tax=Arundo donax TaxID=35708 RepID=A0A0A9HFB6_ARUDO